MFYQIRYQTGELDEVVNELKTRKIPSMDVVDGIELEWICKRLEERGIYKVEGLPADKNARDSVAEPEFECRLGFYSKPVKNDEITPSDLMYIDFYFEPYTDKTYDSCGEM